MGKLVSPLAFFLSWLLPFAVLAAPTFGAEFTMTSYQLITAPKMYPGTDDDISSEIGRDLLEKFADIVRETCGRCTVVLTMDRYDLPAYKVTLPDHFSFMITLDPAVIEIVPSAATREGFLKLEPVLERLIFRTGKILEQAPISKFGGGHVHIGIASTFAGNPVLFRNFFVDWLNHPDLMDAFTGSRFNSPTFYDLPAWQEEKMRSVIAEFDKRLQQEGFLQNPDRDPKRGLELMTELARSIQKQVYTSTLIPDWTPTEKYQALNVTRLADASVPLEQKTIELRFFAGQKSVGEFISLIDLFEGRIEFLKKAEGLVKYEALKQYSESETAARLEKFARDAGKNASDVRESIQQSVVAKLIPPAPMRVACSAVLF